MMQLGKHRANHSQQTTNRSPPLLKLDLPPRKPMQTPPRTSARNLANLSETLGHLLKARDHALAYTSSRNDNLHSSCCFCCKLCKLSLAPDS